MKIRFTQLVTAVFIAMLSAAAFAGGAGCDSMKGHGKHEMSAEAMKEFKDAHSWMFSGKSAHDAAKHGADSKSDQPANSSSSDDNDSMVEI
ncbi:MAG: hypothetical protein PVJ39_06805 [Gammaproteobacteria bacterium]